MNVNAYSVLEALEAKRTENEEYIISARAAKKYNVNLYVPNIFDTLFMGVEAGEE